VTLFQRLAQTSVVMAISMRSTAQLNHNQWLPRLATCNVEMALRTAQLRTVASQHKHAPTLAVMARTVLLIAVQST